MLRPAVVQILKNNESYYSLVLAVAKRARQITDEALENRDKGLLNEKPVKMAVDELASGEYKIIEDPSLR
ncbi:MAG: DNA-directed RNA polymerase subunit omega [Ruminococcus sp.]|nr:DNA-directed RNA polymerase subunit omega [Ruminococcus sp.]